jgi:transcriptional regulator with XRE-family HTH domain
VVERLRYLRKRAGLTQQELGEACGMDGRWARKLESGEARLTNLALEKACALSKALGISERELLAIGEVEDLYSDGAPSDE